MERCGARVRSFEKPRAEAPPRLQVIGFNVSPMKAVDQAAAIKESLEMVISSAASTAASYNELAPSGLAKSAASSPRSALQQLLLHQSLPSTSSNQRSPPLLPYPISSQGAARQTFTAGALLTSLNSSSNQNSASGGLLRPVTSSPSAANQKCTSGELLSFAADQKWTSGVSRSESPAAAYQGNSSRRLLKSLFQSECATLDVLTNQSSRTSVFSSLSQSQCASSSEPPAGSQILNQQTANPAYKELSSKENEAFRQIKHTGDLGNDAKAHAAKSKKSNWLLLHDDNEYRPYGAAEKSKESNWKEDQPSTDQHSLIDGNEKSRKSSRSEEKSKKSSLFMFVASSRPVPEHRHHYPRDSEEHCAFESMEFLSSCHLCGRFLGLGQDVFMYRGDKAFCSMECRYQQILIDERKEWCPPSVIRSGASASPTATHHPIMINKSRFLKTAAAA